MNTDSHPVSFVVRQFFSFTLSMINGRRAWLPNGGERETMWEFLSFGVFKAGSGWLQTCAISGLEDCVKPPAVLRCRESVCSAAPEKRRRQTMNARSVRQTHPAVVDARQFAAVVFDMDGVLTDMARVHFIAWKLLLDEALAHLTSGSAARPFELRRLSLVRRPALPHRLSHGGPRPAIGPPRQWCIERRCGRGNRLGAGQP